MQPERSKVEERYTVFVLKPQYRTGWMEYYIFRCTCVAAASLSPGLARAASVAVVVVPRLDPRVKG